MIVRLSLLFFVKLEPFSPEFIIADSGYKTPSIAKFLLEKGLRQFSLTLDQEVRKIFTSKRLCL